MTRMCSVCGGGIPAIPPDEPDRPEAWHTSVYVSGREFFVHYSCYQIEGPLGSRAYAVAREAA